MPIYKSNGPNPNGRPKKHPQGCEIKFAYITRLMTCLGAQIATDRIAISYYKHKGCHIER